MLTHTGTVSLSSQRLQLRRFTVADAQAMYDNWAKDPEVTRFLSWVPHPDVESTAALLADWVERYENPDYYHWVIVLGGKPIGSISTVKIKEETCTCEIGYCSGKAYWGQGYMTEALNAVIDHMMFFAGFNRVEAHHDVDNGGSGRVMQKAGMRLEGILRQTMRRRDGTLADRSIYAVLRQERESKG